MTSWSAARHMQSAECVLCGWSSDTNGERPREYMLVLRSSLHLHSMPVTFKVSAPSLSDSTLRVRFDK